jgi:hypothetical protein
MWHSRALGFFTFIVAMLALSPTRGAHDDRFHGAACVGKTAADADKLVYDNWGVHNGSTASSARVICPMGYMSDGASFGTTIWHDAPSEPVDCFYVLGSAEGWELFKSPTFRPGVAPWLTNSYTDSAEFLPGGGWTGYLYLECRLPRIVNGAASFVASVYVND